jgi:ketosteroid isomerase-like protein
MPRSPTSRKTSTGPPRLRAILCRGTERSTARRRCGSNVDVSEFEVRTIAANDADVIAVVHWTYTVRATGKTASMYMQHWFRFSDGKITFFRGSEDSEQSAYAFS